MQLGGPIMKDKLWFFGSFQYQKDADSQPGTDPAVPGALVGQALLLQAELPAQPEQPPAVPDARRLLPDSRRAPRPTPRRARSAVETGHNPSPGLLWTSVINPTTVFEARYSGFYGVDHGDPLNGGPRVARRFNDLDTGQITGGIYSWYDGKSDKTAFSGKVTKYADNFLGGQSRLQARRAVQQRPGRVHLRLERLHLHLRRHPGLRLHAAAVHAGRPDEGDRRVRRRHVQIGRATLNLGVRYDDSKGYFTAQDLLDAQRQSDRRAVARPSTSCSAGASSRRASASTSNSTRAARRCSRRTTAATTAASSPASSTTPRRRSRRGTCSRASTARQAVPLGHGAGLRQLQPHASIPI